MIALDLALLLTQLLVILAATRVVGYAVSRVGQPRVIGEMIAGIALGPSIVGAIAPAVHEQLFPAGKLVPLATLSQLGVILFMFVVGLRLDLSLLRGRVKSAVAISHSSIIAPLALGAALGPWLHPTLAGPGVTVLPFTLFLGVAMSITAFPVLARIVDERGLTGTRLGSMAIACAAVDDATAWCLLAGVVAVAQAGDGLRSFMTTLLLAFGYATLAMTVGRRLLDRLAGNGSETERRSPDIAVIGSTVILAVASALITELIGVHALFGAFLAGTIMPRRGGMATAVADRLEGVVGTSLLPVFFAFTGLRTDVALVTSAGLWAVFAAILIAAIAGKLGASALAARLTGMSSAESLAIGLLMNTRGLMELVILNVGLEIGVIGPALFAMMVLMALTTTVMTSPLVGAVLKREPAAALQPADAAGDLRI